MPNDGGRQWTLVDLAKDGGIALYKSQEDLAEGGKTKTADVWALMFSFDSASGGASRSSLIPAFGGAGSERLQMPAKYTMARLPAGTKLGSDALVEMYKNSTRAKGALAVYRYPANDPAHAQDPVGRCVAPVMWWGISDAEAKKDCANSSL